MVLQKTHGTAVFLSPGGHNLSTATIELASLDQLIIVAGTSATKIKYLTFNRLTFMHSFRTLFSPAYQPYELLLRSDWGIARAGALFIQNAENVTVKNCFFDQIGGNGVFMSGYNRNHLVYNNEFTNTGASGVLSIGLQSAVRTPSTWTTQINTITDNTPGPLTADYPQNITINNNLMTNVGVFEKQACGIGISMSSQVTAQHNSVSIAPRAGINFCDGCWGGHLIEYNDVNNCVRETGDHGPLNAWGRDRFWSVPNPTKQMAFLDAMSTTIIRKNRLQDNNGRGYFGVDLDDGSSNYQVSQNLCLSCGVKFREGFVRRSINNIMINGQQHCHVWFNGGNDSIYHDIIVNGSAYDPVSPNFTGDQAYIDCNDFWNNGGAIDISPTTSVGLDAHSVKADPKFTNAAAGNYSVAAGSPALTLCNGGFVNFPMDSFGRMNVAPDTNQPATVGVIASATAAKSFQTRCAWLGARLVVQYFLPSDERVWVGLYSVDGKNIAVLADRQEEAGLQTITWNASAAAVRSLSPAMYLVRMKFGDATGTQKIVLTK